MKRVIPFLVLVVGLAIALGPVISHRKARTEYDLDGFGRLPVLVNGRIKPLDTVARTTLLTLQGRQRVSDPAEAAPFASSPIEWLAIACFDPARANTFPTFRIDSPELLGLMGITEDDTRINYQEPAKKVMAVLGFLPSTRARFSFDKLRPKVEELERQARLADEVEPALRTKFQKAVLTLYSNLVTYQRIQYSLILPESQAFLSELTAFQDNLGKAVDAAKAREAGQPFDEAVLKSVSEMHNRFEFLEQQGSLLAIPPKDGEAATAWRKTGRALLDTFETGGVDPAALAYAGLGYAWQNKSPEDFNEVVRLYRAEIEKRFSTQLKKSDTEQSFNIAEPFYTSITLFVLAFLLGVVSWLTWPDALRQSGFWLVVLAWILTTAGIGLRMWIGGYAPVTNLYSSALGVCWVAVSLCLVLEMIFKNAIGTVAGGAIGFITLIIAHHLSLSGDTMEMMRAVLDSNFWLGTHVVTITIGYGATFLAGFLAILYIFRGTLTRSLDTRSADALGRMVYGIVCFATLFSLVGTILGGIWADQSWGRFWGWDPKENGALIIVLWNALILHCRWGGLVRIRGLMALAVLGNIVTAWSWFGVNMLGVGLHSYGFMDAAFWWLLIFVGLQLAIVALAQLPLEKWKSFAVAAATARKSAP
jgi:ABC-type transport system involved in cytochrome c biogenesis permease subunit